MSDEPKKAPLRRKPGGAPARRGSAGVAATRTPRRKPHSYGQSAELPDAPDTDPETVETPRKPVAKDVDAPEA